MMARYQGKCSLCGGAIIPGQQIDCVNGDWVHRTCPQDVPAEEPPKRHLIDDVAFYLERSRCASAHERRDLLGNEWDDIDERAREEGSLVGRTLTFSTPGGGAAMYVVRALVGKGRVAVARIPDGMDEDQLAYWEDGRDDIDRQWVVDHLDKWDRIYKRGKYATPVGDREEDWYDNEPWVTG